MKHSLKRIVFSVVVVVGMILLGAFLVSAKNSNNNTRNRLMELVSEKLGKGSYTYDYLLDFKSEKRYVLVSGDNCYLIYDIILDDYVEFSNTEKSFYSGLDKDIIKMYLAPTYYFYKNDENIYNLFDDSILSLSDVTNYMLLEEMLMNAYNCNRNGNGTKTGEDDPVYITNRYYFDNLRYNIGSNTTSVYPGSCSYVALGMMLSYYDSIKNDNVIAEEYDVTSTKSFSSYTGISVADYTASPGIDDSFHGDLIQYGRDLGLTDTGSNSISVSNMDELLEEYFDDRNLSITTYTTTSSTNKLNFCKNAINSDNPVLIKISGIDTSISSDNLSHDVVGYGYDNTGIYVHFGWKNNYHTNTNINNYTINNAFYITLNSSHSHSNNYLWTCNGCNGTVCPCGDKTCNHGAYSYTSYNNTYHLKSCNACGNYVYENHHYQAVGSNNVCSDCGHTVSHIHDYTHSYTWLNYNQHRAYCACGGNRIEQHVVSAKSLGDGLQYVTCILCGGPANAGIVPWNKGIQVTESGSFISPNGTLVLADEDIDGYLAGEIAFEYDDIEASRNIDIPPYLLRKDEDCLS